MQRWRSLLRLAAGALDARAHRAEADLGVGVQAKCYGGVAVQRGIDVVQDLPAKNVNFVGRRFRSTRGGGRGQSGG